MGVNQISNWKKTQFVLSLLISGTVFFCEGTSFAKFTTRDLEVAASLPPQQEGDGWTVYHLYSASNKTLKEFKENFVRLSYDQKEDCLQQIWCLRCDSIDEMKKKSFTPLENAVQNGNIEFFSFVWDVFLKFKSNREIRKYYLRPEVLRHVDVPVVIHNLDELSRAVLQLNNGYVDFSPIVNRIYTILDFLEKSKIYENRRYRLSRDGALVIVESEKDFRSFRGLSLLQVSDLIQHVRDRFPLGKDEVLTSVGGDFYISKGPKDRKIVFSREDVSEYLQNVPSDFRVGS